MTDTPVVALAKLADSAAIAALSGRVVEHGLRQSWDSDRIAKSIRHRESNVVVVRIGPALAGFAIMEYGDEDAQLSLLAVDTSFRRRGVARAMVEWLAAAAREAGMAAIRLQVRTTNAGAVAFYRSLGFRDAGVHRGYYQRVEDALFMVLGLRAPD
ncbi:MAG TPA: GNAT family N-acetyltransferase [Xanthomonadales bacterium]|nr:GNAT family N-acetyltransferase [Xanthomonadales bacterium]